MAGIQDMPLRIPEQWDAAWFRQFVAEVLAKMDPRNSTTSGMSVSSDGNSVAHFDASEELTAHVDEANPHPQYALLEDLGVFAQKNAPQTIEGVWTFNAANPLVTEATTVGALPSAVTAGAGARGFVTDANSTTFNAAAAAGGANKVPVFSDGASWKIG